MVHAGLLLHGEPSEDKLPLLAPNDRWLPPGTRQLYLRTRRLAYTLVLYPIEWRGLHARRRVERILDETLYDRELDVNETKNVAYDDQYRGWRDRLLRVAVREWNVSLVEGGLPLHADGLLDCMLMASLIACCGLPHGMLMASLIAC